jgi:hypothetical protein
MRRSGCCIRTSNGSIAKEHPDARTVTGYEAVEVYRREWQEMLPDVRVEFDRLLDTGNAVVAIGTVRGTGAGSGADVRVPIGFIFTLRDGLIARAEEYLDPAEAGPGDASGMRGSATCGSPTAAGGRDAARGPDLTSV